jgi:hypothetical protein
MVYYFTTWESIGTGDRAVKRARRASPEPVNRRSQDPQTDDLQGALFGILRCAPELLQREVPRLAAIAKQEVPELEEPNAASHLRLPAHGMAQPPVGLQERPPDRLGAERYEGFDRLYP